MIFSGAVWRGIAGVGLCVSVAACAPEKVKNVLEDKEGYLTSEFSPSQLSDSMIQSLGPLDKTPVKFHKMVLTVTPQVEYQFNASAKPDYRNTFTMVNAGNGLVQTLDERSQNDIPTTQTYALTYRGLLVLRTQEVVLSNTLSNLVVVTKSFSRVDAVDPATTATAEMEFDRESGFARQVANFAHTKYICKWGAVHPAADIFSKFTGKARDLDCHVLNQNDVQVNRSNQAYLFDYGIVLVTHAETSTFKSDLKVVDAVIQ